LNTSKNENVFVPKMWADSIAKSMQHQSILSAQMRQQAVASPPWEVWFAWFPVRIVVVDRYEKIHDEVIYNSHTEWHWLVPVARRPYRKLRFLMKRRSWPFFQPYNYGPATNALTQPRVNFD